MFKNTSLLLRLGFASMTIVVSVQAFLMTNCLTLRRQPLKNSKAKSKMIRVHPEPHHTLLISQKRYDLAKLVAAATNIEPTVTTRSYQRKKKP